MTATLTIANRLARRGAANAVLQARRRFMRRLPGTMSSAVINIVYPLPALRDGDAERAQKIYQGHFALAGQTVELGVASAFAHAPPSRPWRDALLSFTWLADLAAADSELARAQARTLIGEWIDHHRRRRGPAWDLQITAARTMALLRYPDFYLKGARPAFRDALMASLSRQVRHLVAGMAAEPGATARLHAALAVVAAAVCTSGLEKFLDRASDLLVAELERQILPDGGHISRNPEVVVDLIMHLVPLMRVFEARQIVTPSAIVVAVDRMLPFLVAMRHGDGGIALFNGATAARRMDVSTALRECRSSAMPNATNRHSGYVRLDHDHTVAILDAGRAAAPDNGGAGHAGSLAFELSHNATRIVVNCGHCGAGPEEWRLATGTTAAHSTLVLDGRSSAAVFAQSWLRAITGGPLVIGPDRVESEVENGDHGSVVTARHDGYLKRFGLIHQRQLFVASGGGDVRGEDRLYAADAATPQSRRDFAIRFHLHPAVKATPSQDGKSVLVMLPNRSGWRFTVKGAETALEESIYFDGRDVPQRTQQIVLSGSATGAAKVNWAFRLMEPEATPKASKSSTPNAQRPLPLPLTGGSMNDEDGA